jgi:hypothetical protein
MFYKFIVRGDGHFGCGETMEIAEANYRKASKTRKKKLQVHRFEFSSTREFCKDNKNPAKEDEADAYVNTVGDVCWIRCVKREIKDS